MSITVGFSCPRLDCVTTFLSFICSFACLGTECSSVAQIILKFIVIFPTLHLKCWNYIHEPPHPARIFFLFLKKSIIEWLVNCVGVFVFLCVFMGTGAYTPLLNTDNKLVFSKYDFYVTLEENTRSSVSQFIQVWSLCPFVSSTRMFCSISIQ